VDYFVSISNTVYHHWQLELLIESFKMHGIEDQLCVGVSRIDGPAMVDNTKNLRAHERKFTYNPVEHKNSLTNFPYGLFMALENGFIKQPFAVIHADMVMKSPIEKVPKENITFSGDPYWKISLEKDKLDLSKHINRIAEQKKSLVTDGEVSLDVLPMGGIYVFNDCPKEFFERTVRWSLHLSDNLDKQHWQYVVRSAFMLAMMDYLGGISFQGTYEHELTLLDHKRDANFIHYCKGMPPFFTKKMFTFEPPLGFTTATGDPFSVLMEYDITSTAAYMQKVVKAYKGIK
jgi:hypothetical protein